MSSHSASCSSEISVDLTDAFRSMILNKRFVLWDDFESALKEFQKTTYIRYIHTESRLLKDVRFKYLFVSFNCTFGHERKSEGLKVRQKSSKFRNCQSKFRVRLGEQGYVIKSYNMLHNHPCSSSWMVCDPWTRRLSSEKKENLKPVILHCESADEVIEGIKERTGKLVMDMLIQKGEVKEHLENGYATRICFSKYNQIQVYRKYPEVVCIDSTYNTNNKKYSLFQLVVTDNCGRGRTVMFAWTRREKRADVIWILDQFKEIMGDTMLTETFVMDCARCESAAVCITHEHANIILCAFHVIRAF
ncbi:unnamed protein product [Schistosoma guineensis]|nr:unnamed protein product [Schistosoma guineensis]